MSILNPTKTVSIGGEQVEFRELRARDGIEFIFMVAKHAGKIRSFGGGQVHADLVDIVTGASDVGKFLVLKSSGKDESWLEKISMTELLDGLQAAVDLNLHEVVIKKVQGVIQSIKSRVVGSTPEQSTA